MNIANIHLENNTEIDQSTSSKKMERKKRRKVKRKQRKDSMKKGEPIKGKKKKTIKYQTCTLLNLKKLYHEIQKL